MLTIREWHKKAPLPSQASTQAYRARIYKPLLLSLEPRTQITTLVSQTKPILQRKSTRFFHVKAARKWVSVKAKIVGKVATRSLQSLEICQTATLGELNRAVFCKGSRKEETRAQKKTPLKKTRAFQVCLNWKSGLHQRESLWPPPRQTTRKRLPPCPKRYPLNFKHPQKWRIPP